MAQVRTVRNFLKHVPNFWTSKDWRDCLSCGEFLALDPDFFAEKVVEILEGRVGKGSSDEEAEYVGDKLQEIVEGFLREVRQGYVLLWKARAKVPPKAPFQGRMPPAPLLSAQAVGTSFPFKAFLFPSPFFPVVSREVPNPSRTPPAPFKSSNIHKMMMSARSQFATSSAQPTCSNFLLERWF